MAKKGFGKSTAIPTRQAKKFMLALQKRAADAKKDPSEAARFLQTNVVKLDESLLEALPLVFTQLTANEPLESRQVIAGLFGLFGYWMWQLPVGNRMLNLELAITAHQLALKVFTREDFPEDWAMKQNNLANAYRDRIRGDRAENLEQAISACNLALQVFTREDFPEDWAGTQNNLANAYHDRIRGDQAENLEQAINAYNLALQVYTREDFPERWAMTQNNLAAAYGDRIRGNRAENLEQAINAYNLALQVYTREDFPEKWAMTQNNLANAYSDRIRGDRAENLEQAINGYNLALQVRTNKDFSQDWAATQNNLAIAYKGRIRGDRAENLEQAINACKLAFQVYTREAFPADWARTLHNLANAYKDRIRGDQTENLEQAISIHGQAAQVFSRESYPRRWAINQAALAEVLMKRASLTDNPKDVDTAVAQLQAALNALAAGSPDFIDAQFHLGNALSRRYDYSQTPGDLQQAVQAYKIALDTISPEHYDRQQIWQALPETQSILGSRLVREGKWQEGLQFLLNSINQLKNGDDPLAHANALFQTGRAYEALSDWDNARLYYRDALRLYEHLKDQLGTAQSHFGLGSTLVSQGHWHKGLAELVAARESYAQLAKPDKVAEVNHLCQVAQQAMERQEMELQLTGV